MQLGQDRARRFSRAGRSPDRAPDDDVVGAVGNGLRRGCDAFLVSKCRACGADAGSDDQTARRLGQGADHSRFLWGSDDAIGSGLERACGALDDEIR